ncbi:MAG: extracellular solute-binding protein [Clostridia bacterium]|nr:extracellular solute-binding protein [Clostridia bacterium]
MKTSRLLASLLLLALAASMAACGKEAQPSSQTTADTVSETLAPTGPCQYPDTIPADVHYDNSEFRIGYANAWEINECAYTLDEAEGEIVNEAIYQRNLQTEEKLGIRITGEQLCKSWLDTASTLQKQVQAGDCPYDAVMASEVQLFRASLNNLLIDMRDIVSIDFTHTWWDTEALNMYSLNAGNRYLFSGAINYLDDYSQDCLLFNKKLCREYDLEEPYQLVRDGKWTFDKMMEYITRFGIDLNGDGKMNENDLYGYIGNTGALNSVLYAAGENVIRVDKKGEVSLNTSDRMQTVLAACVDRLLDSNNSAVCIIERKLGYDRAGKIFPEGHALFLGNTFVGEVSDMRLLMEDDFGIIPYPKYDEAQQNYYSALNIVYGTVVSVPLTNADPQKTGWILDLMGYYSVDTVLPTVIEKHIKTKSMRDEESVEMLNLIIGNKFFDIGGWGSSIYDQMMKMCESGNNTYASLAEKYQNITQNEFGIVAEQYDFGK